LGLEEKEAPAAEENKTVENLSGERIKAVILEDLAETLENDKVPTLISWTLAADAVGRG